jgi:transcriptional regulator with GAF, ATPase, and Fis domain
LPVLIEGETGTGKELVASLIHELSPRSRRPFVVIDCSSFPESLADAELFGSARGAYTGAHAEREGLIAQADQGTSCSMSFRSSRMLSRPSSSG